MPVDKLTIEQFAQRVKAKYPQYKDVNDSILVDKIVAKHPEYKDRVNYEQQQPQQQAFQIKISEPTFKAPPANVPAQTFTDQKPVHDYDLARLKNKAIEAKTKIDTELHSNDIQYEKKIREIRRDSFTLDDLKKEAKEKGYIIPTGQEKEVLRLAKQRQYDLPVHPEDVSDIKTGTIVNPDFSRQFIKELNSPEAQKQAYYVDAYNHAADDVNGLNRAAKIKENANRIGKGEYGYDPVNKLLTKKEGFINSVFSGRNDLNKSFDLYSLIKEAPDAKVIDVLNQELAGDIDEPIPVPDGTVSNVGRMMGSQPLKGLLAGGIAAVGATATGHPDQASTAFNLANAGVSAVDMYKIGLANAVKTNYAAFKQQGLSDAEALQKAKVLGEDQANTDAASAAIMSFAAGKMAFKPTGISLSTLRKPLMSALGQIGQAGAKKALEGLGVGSIGGVTQIIKNIQAQNAGLPVETTEGFKDQLEAGALLTAATHVIAKASASLKPSTLHKLTKSLSSVPREAIESNLNEQQQAGHITPEQATHALDIIKEAEALNKLIPEDLPETDRNAIAGKIKERADLKSKLESIDEAYHPEIKEKIKAINEAIINISKGSDRGELQNIVHKSRIDNSVKKDLLSQSEKELQESFKTIAEWANDPASADQATSIFGEDIINKAKELYPQIKTEENASNVRSDEGQVSLSGDGPEGIQEPGGGNIQLQEGAEPVPAEAEQQTGGRSTGESEGQAQSEEGVNPMEGGIPPNMFDLPFTPEGSDVTRLAHADTEAIYKQLGLADRIPRATKEDITLEKQANDLIRNGYDFEGKADRVISGRDKSFTDTEQVAFANMVGALSVKLEGLEVNSPEFNSTLETINRLSRASDIAGSEAGAHLRSRRMFILNDESLAAFMQKAKEANLDVPLTEQQAEAVKAKFEDMKASRDAYRARLEKLAEEYAKAKAERAVKKTTDETSSKPKTNRTHDDYVKERQDIIAKMREDLLKIAKGGGGAMASIPLAPQLIAAAPHIAKLVRSVIEEGVHALPDIIKSVHDQIKDALPGITEKNVHDIIAGEYSKKQTRSDIQEKIYEAHLQAKLINRLEALQAGVQPKSQRSRTIRSAEIEDLRKQIKGLQNPEKSPKSPRTEADTEASRLSALKSRYKKQTDELQKKIDTGDFEPDEKDMISLDKEAIDLKDAYIKKKIEWQKSVANDAYKNRSLKEQGKDFAMEVLGIPRTIMSSMDLSAPLRQGLVLTASHPFVASKAFVESLKQAIDPARFDRWLYDLKQSDYYKNVIEKSGLYIADPGNLSLSAKEEAYMTNLAEKVPIIGNTLKVGGKTIIPGLGLISKSERAYVAYLNKLRVDVFTMYAKGFAEKGMTPETRPDIYEALGAFVNAATGRGELGDLERSAPILNAVFFSPRLIASRLNLLNPVFYASLPKEVRVKALVDMAKMIGLGATTVGLFSLVPGASVEKDPRSPDFGKIKVGNTRWDVWGGFQQYVRLASQLFSGYEKKASGNVVPLGPARNENTKAEKFFGFFRGKLSPIPSLLVDYGMGKTAVGEDVELTSEMKEHLIPMIGNDVMDAWKEQGAMSLVYTGIPSFLGVGTTTYKEKEPKMSKTKAHKTAKQNKKNKKQ
jgi:hypothetical protein